MAAVPVIVLPEGIAGNSSLGYVRQRICERADLLAVVDCPLETFMPSMSTKTVIVVFQKRKLPERASGFHGCRTAVRARPPRATSARCIGRSAR
jgi:hypothetical protein